MSVRTPQVVGDSATYSWQWRLAADKKNSEISSRKQARKSSPFESRRSAIKLDGPIKAVKSIVFANTCRYTRGCFRATFDCITASKFIGGELSANMHRL